MRATVCPRKCQECPLSDFDPYTQPLVDEARRRGIRVSPVPHMRRSYALLQLRGHRELICQAQTDRMGTVGFRVMYDKAASLTLLQQAGLPVVPFVVCREPDDALPLLRTHGAVVVKPVDQSMGRGVHLDLRTPDTLEAAFRQALSGSKRSHLMVQAHVSGQENRLLVIGEEVFGVQRVPAHVLGNGRASVALLIDRWNRSLELSVRRIRVDDALRADLRRQGYGLEDVPADGAFVYLADLSNAHRGGLSHDVTEQMGHRAEALALAVAKLFGAPLVGVDVISPDIARDPGQIIELNPHAGLHVHLHPTSGVARDVAGALIDLLFPETRAP